MNVEAFPHDVANPLARVQRGIGVLENDLHVAARTPKLILGKREDVASFKEHAPARRLQKLQRTARERGFPAAGFPDQPQGFPGFDGQRNATYRLNGPRL